MSKKKDFDVDPIAEQILAESLESMLDQIIDGRMSIKIGEKILIFRESTEAEKFEAEIFGQTHSEDLKKREVPLYDSSLVPLMVRKRCKKYDLDYGVIANRMDIMSKMFEYIQKQTEEGGIDPKSLQGAQAVSWYSELRKKCFSEEELMELEQIEAIEQMVSEMKLKTYEHYADRAKTYFLMARTISLFENGEDKVIFSVTEAETAYGPLPIVDVIEGFDWKMSNAEWITVVEKFNAFIKGVGPNFLSQLSGLLNVGDSSGTPVESAEPSRSKDDLQDGQEIS